MGIRAFPSVLLYILSYVCFPLFIFAQPSPNAHWNEVIYQLRESASRDEFIEKLRTYTLSATPEDMPTLKIIEDVLKAEFHLIEDDYLNDISTGLYLSALDQAKVQGNPALLLWVHTQIGFYYFTYSNLVTAFDYFSSSSKMIEKIASKEMIMPQEVLKKNAYFYGTIGSKEIALDYLLIAIANTSETNPEYANLLNYTGDMFKAKGDLAQAKLYYHRTRKASLLTNDTLRYAKVLGSLAEVALLEGDKQEAVRLYQENISLSKQVGESGERNTMYAQLQLAKIYMQQQKVVKAEELLWSALDYARSKSYLKGMELQILELQLQLAMQRNDLNKELEIRRSMEVLKDYIAETDGPEVINQINWQAQKEQIKWQLEVEKEKLTRASLEKWIGFVITFLLLTVLILASILYRRRFRYQSAVFQKKLLTFQLEKTQSEKKLMETQHSLKSFQIYLTEKNKQIERLEKEIQQAEQLGNDRDTNRSSLEELLQSHLMTDENWNHFKKVFMQEKKEYYAHLMTNFPDLTDANLRIILLQKTGLNNVEIAKILGITLDAVKKAKQRLRKKYVEKYETLFEP